MKAPSQFTKVKIAAGYTLLLTVLLLTLLFVRREMETLAASDHRQSLQSDSLLLLLREKDRNTIQMLTQLDQANQNALTIDQPEEIIAEQDSVIVQQRIHHRVVTKRDTLITKPRQKGFFKRVGELFTPTKPDSAVLLNTSQEIIIDTLLEPYHVVDTLQQMLRTASRQKRQQEQQRLVRHTNRQYQRRDQALTARIDTLVKEYEQELLLQTHRDAAKGKAIRQRSTRALGGIAIGAVLLSALFLILILRDITRSNRYRRQLEQANRRAEALIEAREQLMLAITHDFKAPLSSIIGYTDLLAQLTPNEQQHLYLDNMKSSSAHLLKLVNDLLEFHRLDLHKAEINRITFNPAHLFNQIHISFSPLTQAKGLTLHYLTTPELNGRFISDPLRIRQLITNLLSNAIKFTSQGTVTLTLSYAHSRLRIDVADTGKGIQPTDRERIFQEFTRLPNAQGEEGFGLGLSIVSKLVTLLEGEIQVQSTLGEGSVFTVVLPLFPVGGNWNSAPENQSDEQSANRPLNLLLIDDDRIQLTLTAAMLASQGIHTVCCWQLEQLTEHLRTTTFDLLLTDIQMPTINGFDLLKLLRASNIPQARTLPIIAVTARSEMKAQEFLAHGFAGCLHKPFTTAELLAMVNALLPKANQQQQESVSQPLPINFAALTAFSQADAQTAHTLMQTFVNETRKDIARMQLALDTQNISAVADVAHKLLPLFTLIEATPTVRRLTILEASRTQSFSTELQQQTIQTIESLSEVIDQAPTSFHHTATVTTPC